MSQPLALPGTICWVAPNWERGLVVAVDPQGSSVCVAYCDHARGNVKDGVFPQPADLGKKAPLLGQYTRKFRRAGATFTDTTTTPPYFAVEWVPTGELRFAPPDAKGRPAKLQQAYEPLDAVFRGLPSVLSRSWELEARLAAETGDAKTLFALPVEVSRLRVPWTFTEALWSRPDPRHNGRLRVERERSNWAWEVSLREDPPPTALLSTPSRFDHRRGVAENAYDALVAAEAAFQGLK